MAMGRGIFLGLVLAFVLVGPVLAAGPSNPGADVFTVTVPVDATAANAAAARDAARAEGQRHAYTILLDRLTLAADRNRLPPPTDATLNEVTVGYEVANERNSGVRYLADYTFHFRPDAVRSLLRQAAIPFADTPSKPVVVLPVLTGGPTPLLWEDPNPWRDAWTNNPPPFGGLVPIVVPYGELDDIQAIDAEAALKGDPASLQAISKRYGGADVLVAQATLAAGNGPDSVAVKATRYDAAQTLAPQSWDNTYAAGTGESDADLFAAAVAGTARVVEDAWKTANIIQFGHVATMVVRVPLDSLRSWVTVRDRLTGIPAIAGSELQSLDRDAAHVTLHYYGDPNQLRVALAQRDLELTGSDPDWMLELQPATAAH